MTGMILEKVEREALKSSSKPVDVRTPLKIVAVSLTDILCNTSTDVEIERIIFNSLFPEEELSGLSHKIFADRLDETTKADIIIRILCEIHENWASQSQSRFFNPNYEDEQYLFMPAELVGFKNLMAGYVFIQDIAKALGLNTGIRVLEEAYGRTLRVYKTNWHIKDTEALAAHIQHRNLDYLGMDIRAWKAKTRVAERLAIQIVKVNGLPERW